MKLITIILAFTLMTPQALAFNPYLAEKYPDTYAEKYWDFQELLQEKWGSECSATGQWITFRTKYIDSVKCVSRQRWAVKWISKWYNG